MSGSLYHIFKILNTKYNHLIAVMVELGWQRVLHWGPIVALTIIGTISTCAINCHLMWWPPVTPGGILHLFVFLMWNVLTLYNFFNAMYIGPGHVPFEWKPADERHTKYLQKCTFCEGYKTPRSHHCRKCQRCVMKMDHHCPWINNCVGHFNHASFTYFLFFAPCGCIHACCILFPAMYRALFRHYYLIYGSGDEPMVILGIYGFVGGMFSIGLAIGVVIAVGCLGVIQLRTIIKNETGIESWIKSKAEYRERSEEEGEFIYPYNLGRINNLKQVFTWTGKPKSDGITWDVRERCNQYTLTIEQINQKREKKCRSVVYDIRKPFSGSMCPCTQGCKVLCCPPCTDEPRIKLATGDKVLVSRWKKHWLYGDKILDATTNNKDIKRIRGWFPRKCAAEPIRSEPENEPHEQSHDQVIKNKVSHDTEVLQQSHDQSDDQVVHRRGPIKNDKSHDPITKGHAKKDK